MARFFVMAGMLIGLPLIGIRFKGLPVGRYLQFPPETRYVIHAPFSWAVFLGLTLFLLVLVIPLVRQALTAKRPQEKRPSPAGRIPWWGWAGVFTGAAAWIVAWTRFSWCAPFQAHTFIPLWLSYILVVNGLIYRKTGRCTLVVRPRFFLLLFPLSAAFWWFFEYLNRFVQNWYYVGVQFGPWEYFWYATLSFSTVLPAFQTTRDWVLTLPWVDGFRDFLSFKFFHPKVASGLVLIASGVGLATIGAWPNYLFPLLWVSPLLIIVALNTLGGRSHVLSPMASGDWRGVIASAFSALFCGFFWEMWNFYSLAKWEYSVPFVHRFEFFEMPVLGYAGYLPFGLECALIVALVEKRGQPF